MVIKLIVSLELGRIICIIADDCMDDPLFVPQNIIDDRDVLTAGPPQGSYTIFETLRIIYRLGAPLACEGGGGISRLLLHLVRSDTSASNLPKYNSFLGY